MCHWGFSRITFVCCDKSYFVLLSKHVIPKKWVTFSEQNGKSKAFKQDLVNLSKNRILVYEKILENSKMISVKFLLCLSMYAALLSSVGKQKFKTVNLSTKVSCTRVIGQTVKQTRGQILGRNPDKRLTSCYSQSPFSLQLCLEISFSSNSCNVVTVHLYRRKEEN